MGELGRGAYCVFRDSMTDGELHQHFILSLLFNLSTRVQGYKSLGTFHKLPDRYLKYFILTNRFVAKEIRTTGGAVELENRSPQPVSPGQRLSAHTSGRTGLFGRGWYVWIGPLGLQ